jgi:hypothetical protein
MLVGGGATPRNVFAPYMCGCLIPDVTRLAEMVSVDNVIGLVYMQSLKTTHLVPVTMMKMTPMMLGMKWVPEVRFGHSSMH